MEDTNGANNSPRYGKRRRSGQQTQMERATEDADKQTTYRGITNADKASYKRHRQVEYLLKHSRRRRSKPRKKQMSRQFIEVEQT